MTNHQLNIENKIKIIHGWGKFNSYKSNIFYPKTMHELKHLINVTKNDFIVRGMGRSYGDSSINDNVISLEKMKKNIALDIENKSVKCSSNITYKELNKYLIQNNFFPIVTPGSQYVTIGGAVASDVHGKNHHVDGSFCEHIISLEVLNQNANIIKCSNNDNKSFFNATNGGMGLTGVILSVSFKTEFTLLSKNALFD